MTTDDDVWKEYAAGVRKTGRKVRGHTEPALTPNQRETRQAIAQRRMQDRQDAVKRTLALPLNEAAVPMATIDKGIERKLLRGRIEFDGKLDLHGDTQADAQERLARFVLRKADEGARRLLVVTGKGREGQSILRQNLPRWCGVAPLDKIVLALRPAAPQHGGDGAFYLILRRHRAVK